MKTEEGNAAARFFGLPEAYTTVEESVNGLLAKVSLLDTLSLIECVCMMEVLMGISQLDAASREETSGKFLSFDETPLVW